MQSYIPYSKTKTIFTTAKKVPIIMLMTIQKRESIMSYYKIPSSNYTLGIE